MSYFRWIVLRMDGYFRLGVKNINGESKLKKSRGVTIVLTPWAPPPDGTLQRSPLPLGFYRCVFLCHSFFSLNNVYKNSTSLLAPYRLFFRRDNTIEYLTSGIWPQTPELNNRNLDHPLSRIHNASFPDRSCILFLSKFLEIKARQSQSSFIYGIT